MPAVTVNIRGVTRARRRFMRLRAGLNQRRNAVQFERQFRGAMTEAAFEETPRPGNNPRPTGPYRLIRTGNLISTFRVRFTGPNTLRIRWGARYASFANRNARQGSSVGPGQKYARGYVGRTVRNFRARVRLILAEELRKAVRAGRI